MLSPIELERELQALMEDSDIDDFDTAIQKVFYEHLGFESQIQCLDELIDRIKDMLQNDKDSDDPALLKKHRYLLFSCIKNNFDGD